jgi:tetratricopeptide (TPR) repeat protein
VDQNGFFASSLFKRVSTGLAVLLVFAALALAGAREDCSRKEDRGAQIEACTAVINSDDFSGKERAVAHFYRGSARDIQGETTLAIEDYDAALLLNPEMYAAYYNRANAYFALDDYSRAIADYDNAIRYNPAAAHAYNNRGEAFSRLGENQLAIESLSAALRIDPNYVDAYRNRGVVYEDMGRYELAVRDWDQEIELGGTERARWWQEYLTTNGHYSGEIDGRNSPAVWVALTACAIDPDC